MGQDRTLSAEERGIDESGRQRRSTRFRTSRSYGSIEAIEATREENRVPGDEWLLDEGNRKLRRYRRDNGIPEPRRLTNQEYLILWFASFGKTAVQTGRLIFLSEETVKSYRKRIILKLNANNIMHAVGMSCRDGTI